MFNQPRVNSRTVSWHDLAWPADWAAMFGASRPLIVEIGFGHGAFLVHLARTFPQHNIIGLEINNRSIASTERLIAREKVTNVRLIHSTAETALAHLIEPAAVEQIHINFPDPWFKTKHSHRRLLRRENVDWMVSRLAPGGSLYLATDIFDYATMSADVLLNTPGLDNLLPAPYVNEMPGRTVTKYEAEAKQAGRTCYYFAFRRNAIPAADLPVIKELDMPHLVFRSPVSLDAMNAAFTDQIETHLNEGELHINFMGCYRGRDSLLIETAVSEPTIDQRVALLVLERWREGKTDEYTIQLSTLGHPRPTEGIHRAVRLLADRLLALHPDSVVLNQKLRE
ncbi:MAG: tRNA (guanosine(46)-N7)-methyltransferase TrmB [Anaerolineae bacterium]